MRNDLQVHRAVLLRGREKARGIIPVGRLFNQPQYTLWHSPVGHALHR